MTALARGSGDKPGYQALASRGVKIVTVDLNDAVEVIAKSLDSIDVVIAAVPPHVLEAQIPLARAAKLAGVKRFVPSSFAMALAPGGVATVQDSVSVASQWCFGLLCELLLASRQCTDMPDAIERKGLG